MRLTIEASSFLFVFGFTYLDPITSDHIPE